MKTYKQLEKEFQDKVNELQSKCKHKKLSEWMECYWAPGHSSGTSSRICLICQKKVYSEYPAKICKCGKINHWWMGSCIECGSKEMQEYIITEKLGKLIKKVKVK